MVMAGCADEARNDCKGIAHYLEHLVLVGRNAEHKESAVRFFGDGSSNGWTSDKQTVFIHQFPAKSPDVAERLDKLFSFYAARLKAFDITPEDATRERNVVMQEYNVRDGTSAYAATVSQVNQFLYPDHPLGQRVVGTPQSIAQFSVEEARLFLARWYRKSNVYFMVSGPVDEVMLTQIAARHLTGLDMTPPPERTWMKTRPSLTPAMQAFRKEDARVGQLSVNLARIAPFAETDQLKTFAALTVLNQFLQSKLKDSPHSVLVEQDGIAATVTFANVIRPMDGVLSISLSVTPEEDASEGKVIEALEAYMTRLAQVGIDDKTVERLKKRFAQNYARTIIEPQNTASRLIGWLGAALPYERMKETPIAVAAVTAAEVNALIRDVQNPGRVATLIFAPKVTQ
jgi:zinc protease